MSYGFVLFEYHGGSRRPFMVDLITVLLVGVFPLSTGILMFQQRYTQVQMAMKFVFAGCVAVFVLCAAGFYLFPANISDSLNVPAAAGLIGAVLSVAGWMAARIGNRIRARQGMRYETRKAV